MDMQLISNQLDYETFREIEKDGKTWLVVNGVPVVEGVLNGFMVPFDEFGMYPYDWNDMPIVLNHPSENNGSARVSSPDVPVIGRFHNTTVDKDGRRLTGEFWLEKDVFLATDQGPDLYEKMKHGQPIEISTGYFAPGTTPDHGKFNGKEYQGIHKGIHPDHIAILTNQIGACSLMDGCGLNRNSAVQNCDSCPMKVIANMTGNLPAEGKKIFEEVFKKSKSDGKDEETAAKIAWTAVKKAGWSCDDSGKWMKHNAEEDGGKNHAMIALMLPDPLKAELQKAYPFMDDATRNDLHITIVFLGDNRTLDKEAVMKALFDVGGNSPAIKGKLQGIARFVGEGDADPIVVTFDSPQITKLYSAVCNALGRRKVPYHDNHSFIPHMTLGYIKKGEAMPVDTMEPMEINFSELSFVSGTEILPATLEGWQAGSPYENSEKGIKITARVKQNHYGKIPTKNNEDYAAIFLKARKEELAYRDYDDPAWHNNQQSAKQSPDWFAKAKTVLTKENLMQNKVLKAFLHTLGFDKVTIEDEGEGLSLKLEGTGDDKALENLVQLNTVVANSGGATEFAKTLETLKALPATVEGMQKQMNDALTLIKNASAFVESAASKADAAKKGLIAGLVQNKACPFDETTLNGMSLDVLDKLNASYQPVDYSGLGAGLFHNSGDDKPLILPKGYLAKTEPVKAEA